MFIFYLVNTFLLILLTTNCCWSNVEKRQKIFKNIEGFLGFPERKLIENIENINKIEMNNDSDSDNEITQEEKEKSIEETKKILQEIHDELEKKLN